MSTGRTASTSKVVTSQEDDEIRDYEQCGCQIGCGSCKTKRLPCKIFNCCNNAKGALFFLSGAALVHGFVINGLTNIVITTLEKRFNLSSSETGFIASCYDIGTCLSLLFVTYVGGRGHKPLWLGWGTLLLGLGSIVFSLPHFIAPTHTISSDVTCANLTSVACVESNLRVYRGFFILSQLLNGMGAAPLYTLAITYLDENVKQVYSSLYHGIFYTLSVVGPGIGYVVGGQFLASYTNLGETVNITPLSVLWVGNWWAGFLIGGVCFIILSIPIFMYPRQLPFTDKHRLTRKNEMHQNSDAVEIADDKEFGKSIRDFPRSLWIILKNPTIVFLSLAAAMNGGVLAGLSTFGPKYLQSMFRITASTAAFFAGSLAIISSALGQIIGGVVVSKFKLTIKRMLAMCTFSAIAGTACFFIYIMKCDNTKIAGVTVPFNGESFTACNSTCGCSTSLYSPVCGFDNMTYLSYCDAECVRVNLTHFKNCGRVLNSVHIDDMSDAYATTGVCVEEKCGLGYIFFGSIIGLGVFFAFLDSQPGLQTSLRSVPFFQRSFAVGLQWLIIRLFGSIPMPIIFGRVLDSSCEVWDKQCEECGSCKVYNNNDMSRNFTIAFVLLKSLSVIFFGLAWITYRAPKSDLSTVDDKSNSKARENEAFDDISLDQTQL